MTELLIGLQLCYQTIKSCVWKSVLTDMTFDMKIVVHCQRHSCSVFNTTLRWRHNERDGVSNHHRLDGLRNLLFRRRSKKTSKFRVTGLWVRNSPVTGEFLSSNASNAENVSIWCHHGKMIPCLANLITISCFCISDLSFCHQSDAKCHPTCVCRSAFTRCYTVYRG